MIRVVVALLVVLLGGIAYLATTSPSVAPTASTSAAASAAAEGGASARDGVLAAGAHYVVALTADGRAFGWGGFETGNGAHLLSAGKRPRVLFEGSGYRRMHAGHRAIYVLDAEGRLRRAPLSAVVDGTPTPSAVFGDQRWTLAIERWGIGAGIDRQGNLWYWSDEDVEDQLAGRSGDLPLASPRALMPGVRFADLCIQNARLHAIDERGRLWRSADLLPRGLRDRPLQGARADLDALAAGAELHRVYCRENATHVLALDGDGRLWGYGPDLFGELGSGKPNLDGDRTAMDATELQRLSERTWIALAVAPQVSLGIAADGSLWGWGRNLDHELGLGDTDSRTTPTLIDDTRTWTAVAATYGTGIALDGQGALHAWGSNALGALGDGGIAATHDRPAAVLTDTRFGD